jgi:hypothetical protein
MKNVWNLLQTFDIFYGHFGIFFPFWYKNKNLATLISCTHSFFSGEKKVFENETLEGKDISPKYPAPKGPIFLL